MSFQLEAMAVAALLAIAILAGCGGGGSTESGTPLPTKILSWAPPDRYTDGTPLNPGADLGSFEIYLKDGGPFTNSDQPVAQVAAVDLSTGQRVNNFNLANLAPYITLGVQYQVSVKAVTVTGGKSEFSAPATFSF